MFRIYPRRQLRLYDCNVLLSHYLMKIILKLHNAYEAMVDHLRVKAGAIQFKDWLSINSDVLSVSKFVNYLLTVCLDPGSCCQNGS